MTAKQNLKSLIFWVAQSTKYPTECLNGDTDNLESLIDKKWREITKKPEINIYIYY